MTRRKRRGSWKEANKKSRESEHWEIKIERNKLQLDAQKSCLKMNSNRGYEFLLLAVLLLSLCIDISLGAPKRNPLEKADAKAESLEKKAAVSDIKFDKLSSL